MRVCLCVSWLVAVSIGSVSYALVVPESGLPALQVALRGREKGAAVWAFIAASHNKEDDFYFQDTYQVVVHPSMRRACARTLQMSMSTCWLCYFISGRALERAKPLLVVFHNACTEQCALSARVSDMCMCAPR
jgi:hypothetical protein